MRLTLPHYFNFGDDLPERNLDTPEAWDHLRTQTTGPFAMASDRDELAAMLSGRPEIAERAVAITELADGSLASYGVGGGLLEAALGVPRLILTDAAPATVERLPALFPEARVVLHDLRSDGPLDADLHLFHRVDTEFTNREWRRIFRTFGDQRIVFVAGGIQTPKMMWREVRRGLREYKRHTRAGLLRNRAAVEGLWRRTHRSESVWLGDTEGWVLEPH